MVNEVKELFDFIRTGDISVVSARSRAASSTAVEEGEPRITEVVNGLIVTRPVVKYTDLSKQQKQEHQQETSESEPVVVELGGSKAGSVPRHGINPVKKLFDFLSSNGRI